MGDIAAAAPPGGTPTRKTHRGHRGGQRSHANQQSIKPQHLSHSQRHPRNGGDPTVPTVELRGVHTSAPHLSAAGVSSSAQARDAKGLAMELRDMLKRREPWDREVEFQRQSLRRQYRSLIFAGPEVGPGDEAGGSSSRPKKVRAVDALNLLWLETSHSVIHLYRQRISAMDKALAEAHRSRRRNNREGSSNNDAAAAPRAGERGNTKAGRNDDRDVGPVARRKLVTAFRNFLANEETFWRELFIQLVRTFGVTKAEDAIQALGLKGGMDAVIDPAIEDAMNAEYRSGGLPLRDVAMGQARLAVEHEHAVLLVHKALICFGDLARYRELYNELPSKKDPSNRGGGGRKGRNGSATKDASAVPERSWHRASECYHQARLLLPDNGNPSNQLAVVASYTGDQLSSAYHYYRALCVRTAFPTARPNLEIMYDKALARWRKNSDKTEGSTERKEADGAPVEGRAEADNADQAMERKVEVAARLKTDFVALHAILFTRKRFEEVSELNKMVCKALAEAVRIRAVPSEVIVKMVVTAIAALWNARISRNESKGSAPLTTGGQNESAPHAVAVEAATASHALDLFATLMDVTLQELDGIAPPTPDGIYDLGQSIPAPLRRVLPSLRIVGKWTIGHIDYIQRLEDRLVGVRDPSLEVLRPSKASFWTTYVDMMNTFAVTFPPELLPSLDGSMWLEEDLDMLGFSPLRRSMREGSTNGMASAGDGRENIAAQAPVRMADTSVHPNDEQLMRIADLQSDAKLVALSNGSPVALLNGRLAAFIDGGASHLRSDEELDDLARQHLVDIFGPVQSVTGGPNGQVGRGYPFTIGEAALAPVDPNWIDGDDGRGKLGISDAEEVDDLALAQGDYDSTEGDVIDMAMRHVVEQQMADEDSDEDEDDVVVYPTSRSNTEVPRPSANPSTSSPLNGAGLPVSAAVESSIGTSYSQGRTAADLLNALTGGSSTVATSAASPSLASVSNLGPSIWAALPGEGSPSALGGLSTAKRSPHAPAAAAADMSRQRSGAGLSSVRDIWAQTASSTQGSPFGAPSSGLSSLGRPNLTSAHDSGTSTYSAFPDLLLYQAHQRTQSASTPQMHTHHSFEPWQPQAPTNRRSDTLSAAATPFVTASHEAPHFQPHFSKSRSEQQPSQQRR